MQRVRPAQRDDTLRRVGAPLAEELLPSTLATEAVTPGPTRGPSRPHRCEHPPRTCATTRIRISRWDQRLSPRLNATSPAPSTPAVTPAPTSTAGLRRKRDSRSAPSSASYAAGMENVGSVDSWSSSREVGGGGCTTMADRRRGVGTGGGGGAGGGGPVGTRGGAVCGHGGAAARRRGGAAAAQTKQRRVARNDVAVCKEKVEVARGWGSVRETFAACKAAGRREGWTSRLFQQLSRIQPSKEKPRVKFVE